MQLDFTDLSGDDCLQKLYDIEDMPGSLDFGSDGKLYIKLGTYSVINRKQMKTIMALSYVRDGKYYAFSEIEIDSRVEGDYGYDGEYTSTTYSHMVITFDEVDPLTI